MSILVKFGQDARGNHSCRGGATTRLPRAKSYRHPPKTRFTATLAVSLTCGVNMDMSTAVLAQGKKVSFQRSPGRPITKLALVGPGDVSKTKILPAAEANGHAITDIAVVGIDPQSPLGGLRHRYYQVETDSQLPLDRLDQDGFL